MSMPEWLVPMAATLTQERFTQPDWIFERKYDGIRILAFKRGREVKLYSRNRLGPDFKEQGALIVRRVNLLKMFHGADPTSSFLLSTGAFELGADDIFHFLRKIKVVD